MWIGDVGQDAWEEIDFRAAASTGGINYGWRCYEGTHPYNTAGCAVQSSYVSPVFEYPHNPSTGGNSVTGGFVYRGAQYPDLFGYYVCIDFISGNGWLIKPDGSGGYTSTIQPSLPTSVVAIGETENGELYAVNIGGSIYRVSAGAALPATIARFNASCRDGDCDINWKTLQESNLDRFSIEYAKDGLKFSEWFSYPSAHKPNGAEYSSTQRAPITGQFFARLKWIETSGHSGYSQVVKLNSDAIADIIRLSKVTTSEVDIDMNEVFASLTIVDNAGNVLYKSTGGSLPKKLQVNRSMPHGVYTIVAVRKDGSSETKRFSVL